MVQTVTAPPPASAGASAPAAASPNITFTGTTAAGSNQLTALSSLAGLVVGQEITGVGIPAVTKIQAINAAVSSLTMSQNSTYANTNTMTAFVAATSGAVPAGVANSRPRGVLAADGVFRHPEDRYRYKFDDARRFKRYRAARANVQSRRPATSGDHPAASPNLTRNVLIFGDSACVAIEPNIPWYTATSSWACAAILNGFSFNNAYRQDSHFPNAASDPRVVATGGGNLGTQNRFVGMPSDYLPTNGSGLDFTPDLPWDRMTVVYGTQIQQTTWTGQCDTDAPVAVSQSGASDKVTAITFNASKAAVQTFHYKNTASVGEVYGFIPWLSTTPQIHFVNMGAGGGTVVGHVNNEGFSNQMSPAQLNSVLNPCMVIFNWGYEIAGQRSAPGQPFDSILANFKAAAIAWISAWQALGVDVLINSMHTWDDVNLYKDQPSVRQAREVMYQIADQMDVPLIDNFARWNSWPEAVGAGFIEHYARPLPAGAWDIGEFMAKSLLSI